LSLFVCKITADPLPSTQTAPVDWETVRAEILSKLDLVAEYEALGVRFVRRVPTARGSLECHSIDRPDESPSAAVFLPSGVYADSGSGSKGMGFFDFALKYGDGFGKFADVLKFYAEKAGITLGKITNHGGGGFREATYLYRDATGEVAYAAFRYKLPNGKKRFSLHASDGRGGWKFGEGNMAGVAPLPYRLPELLASDPDEYPVFIVEGEKVAERAALAGRVATTNHMGAKATDKTWPSFVEHFRDRTCFVLPDADEPGRAHARKVCAYLAPVARSIKLVELPGLPAGGDLVDWLDMGHDPDELGPICSTVPDWTPDAPVMASPAAGPEQVQIDDGLPPDDDVVTVCLADVVAVPVEWLWPSRVPLGKLTLLAGEAKLGKSFLTMDFIARVSAGLEIPCGGGECMPRGSVVLLSAEDDLADTVKPRLIALGADFSKIHALTTIRISADRFGPFNLSYIPHLEKAVLRQGDTKLIVIDPVPHYVGNGTDDHKNAQTRQLLEPLKDMANRLHIAVLMVTHLNKGNGTKALNRVTGSGAYTALARSNWLVVKDKDDPKRRLFLSAGTNLCEDPAGLAYRINRETNALAWETEPVLMTADDALAASMEAKKEDIRASKGPRRSEQVQEWLAAQFVDGARILSDDLITRGKAAGFGRDSLFQAKAALGIRARKLPEDRGLWSWLPPDTSDTSTLRHFDGSDNGELPLDHPF